MQARLHSPTDVWSKLWCSFWHIINTLQQKNPISCPLCVSWEISTLLGGLCCHSPEVLGEGMDVVCREAWMEL